VSGEHTVQNDDPVTERQSLSHAGPPPGSPAHSAAPVPVRRTLWQRAAKRTIDLVGASLLLILLAPLLLVIAAAVLVVDGRPILYPWRVLGEGARPFTGYKFRTMIRDADTVRERLAPGNEMRGPVFKMRADPRITPLGRILRRYSLDELPQLGSVLIGHMSLVGPRPVYPLEYAAFSDEQRRKLSVRPGVTCLWQISGRSEINDFEEWIRLDLRYIDEWSLRLDLEILLKTVPAVLSGRGAW
jgi:lipopolysaccharide/colanic/teichoic acid biosynthesis glycosyltransferase